MGTFTLGTFRDADVHSHMQSFQTRVKLQLTPCLLLLTSLQLRHLPCLVSNSFCLFTECQPLCASCCTLLPDFSTHCTVGLKAFSLCYVFTCLLCIICVKKYYKPITVQYYSYIANCISWVPKIWANQPLLDI